MTAPTGTQPGQQADLEQLVTRIARRAADAVARQVADLGTQLALAQESLENAVAALSEKDRHLADKDAELARAHQTAEQLRARVAEIEQTPSGDDGETPTD